MRFFGIFCQKGGILSEKTENFSPKGGGGARPIRKILIRKIWGIQTKGRGRGGLRISENSHKKHFFLFDASPYPLFLFAEHFFQQQVAPLKSVNESMIPREEFIWAKFECKDVSAERQNLSFKRLRKDFNWHENWTFTGGHKKGTSCSGHFNFF